MLIVYKFRTQERFAATIGMNEATVSKLVRGISTPSMDQKALICTALNVEPEELFSQCQTF